MSNHRGLTPTHPNQAKTLLPASPSCRKIPSNKNNLTHGDGIMSRTLFALATFMLAVAPNLQAQDLNSSPVPVAYINVPFGGNTESTPSYGLQLARVQEDRSGVVNLFQSIPYADLKFNSSELEAFSLNGINTLQKVTRYNANGTAQTSTEVNWWLVGGGILVGGYMLYKITEGEGGGDDCPPIETFGLNNTIEPLWGTDIKIKIPRHCLPGGNPGGGF